MDEDENQLTLANLIDSAFDGLEKLLKENDLEYETSSIAAFTIVYGVNMPDGGIAIGHATPTNFRYDTPLVLNQVADILHEANTSEIGRNN